MTCEFLIEIPKQKLLLNNQFRIIIEIIVDATEADGKSHLSETVGFEFTVEEQKNPP